MIQVLKDGKLFYDSRIQRDDMRLLSLTGEKGLNKGGIVTLTMDYDHKDYATFVSYKSIIEIWKNGKLDFRGRALYPQDDFLRRRTITCEGEKCFLRDAVLRPYLYQTAPKDIFTTLITEYNAQVEVDKQFVIGEITVTDPNGYVALQSESAEQVLDAVDKLVERCGGVITFTSNSEGKRVINWYDEVAYSTNQTIEFGENLLDYARTDDNPEMLTAVLPYGAEIEETEDLIDSTTGEVIETITTKRRITIADVNGGVDYIQDAEAVALRGFICKPVYFDDITLPGNLLLAAKKYLAEKKMVVTTLELSAVDLSILDKNIDSFREGDLIKVKSKPHGLDEYFLLTDRATDYLSSSNDKITLGKSTTSLVGSSTSGHKANANSINKLNTLVGENAKKADAALEETKQTISSLVRQTSDSILAKVSEEYATQGQVTDAVSTSYNQTKSEFEFQFNELKTIVDSNGEQIRESQKYIRFVDGDILLGEEGNALTLKITKERISFYQAGGEVAYFSNNKLYVKDGEYTNSMTLGNFAFLPRENGNLTFKKVR